MYMSVVKNFQVVEGVPYVTSLEILEKYNCDVCAHGGRGKEGGKMLQWNVCII